MSKSANEIQHHAAVTYQSSSKNADSSSFNQFQRNGTGAPRDDNEGGTKRSAPVCDSYSWEPSTLFQPSFPLTQRLLSRAISIRDGTEPSKPGEVDSISDACHGSSECKSFEQSLGGDYKVYNNITNKQNYKNVAVPVETGTPVTGRETVHMAGKEANVVDMTGKEANVEISKGKAEDPIFMRSFRTALKEKVKQVVRPTWLEGKLSKKAHNKIVKKTVDRIIGNIKQFPSTLESADPFSSSLEQNIANLVKHYTGKYGKP